MPIAFQAPKGQIPSLAPKLASLLAAITLSLGPALQAQAIDIAAVEREIHRLTNEMRAEQGVAPLEPLTELDGVARRHSENMAHKDFFNHRDPEGRDHGERMQAEIPQLYNTHSGENIAYRSGGEDALTAARELMTQWRDSPGHYQNIMNPGFLQLGVGVGEDDDGSVYATQLFIAGLVLLEQGPSPQQAIGSTAVFRFRFLAPYPPEELNIYGMFPKHDVWVKAEWSDAKHFVAEVPTDQGAGKYRLGIGRSGRYFPTHFGFEAIAP